MGEQSRDSDPDEPVSYDPFVRSAVEYDATTRIQMAEDVASSRRLFVSSALKEIIGNPEHFSHECQQSAKMSEDANQRRRMSFNTKREAFILQKRTEGLPLPSKIPMIEINPTRVTLSLEVESQYYSLMTNDYGDHENVASIMEETNTLIQIPDRSVGPVPDPFAQQVTITGHYIDVDRARSLMRKNCHVSVMMSLSEMKISVLELKSYIGRNPIQNVDLFFIDHPRQKDGRVATYLRFTSRAKNENELIKSANIIVKRAYGAESPPENNFSLHFTLSTFFFDHVIGSSTTSFLMPVIEKYTKTKISYPKVNTRDEIRDHIFVIKVTGAVDEVLKARKCIMDLLPISLFFDLKNSDMSQPSRRADRYIEGLIEGKWTAMKVGPSVYEPVELLSEEVPLLCISLRSKEFNMKNLLLAYEQLLAKNLGVVVPQPEDYDDSIWNGILDSSFFSLPVQCRGESSNSALLNRRQRTSSVTSSRSKQCISSKEKHNMEPSGLSSKSHTRVPTVSECASIPVLAMPPFPDQIAQAQLNHILMMQQRQNAFLKGTPGLPPGSHLIFPPPFYYDGSFVVMPFRPDCPFPLDAINCFQMPSSSVNEAVHPNSRPESELSSRFSQTNRKPQKNGSRPQPFATTHLQSTSAGRQGRVYDQVTDDEARSSPRSDSRRTSISGDETLVGNTEERGYDRQSQRPFPRALREDMLRWKTGSRGDIHVKNSISIQKDVHAVGSARDHEFHNVSPGPTDLLSSVEQHKFQMTHHLKLKPNEIDLEQERLFTHDSPQVEEQIYAPGGCVNELMDGDFVQRFLSSASLKEQGRRSRATSCYIEKDDQSARFNDSDCSYSITDQSGTHQSRSIDNLKKMTATVTKTILEPRSRNEREYGIISLEHKWKFTDEQNDEEKYPGNGGSLLGSRQFRMDPMKLIASVHESSEQLPRIHERQFNDVLNDKEKEMAAFRERASESIFVQDASLDDSSPLDYAFHSEKSS